MQLKEAQKETENLKKLEGDIKLLKSSESSLKKMNDRTVKDFELKLKELTAKGIQDAMMHNKEKARLEEIQAKSSELEKSLAEKDNHLEQLKSSQSAGSKETDQLK